MRVLGFAFALLVACALGIGIGTFAARASAQFGCACDDAAQMAGA